MTDQNNIGDFFRNKLNEKGQAEGGWDKPDPSVKSTVLDNIGYASSSGLIATLTAGKVIAGIILLSLLVFGYSQHHSVNQLKTALANEKLLSQEQALLLHKQSNLKEKLEKKYNKNIKLKDDLQAKLESKNYKLESDLVMQSSQNRQLEREILSLKNQIAQYSYKVKELLENPHQRHHSPEISSRATLEGVRRLSLASLEGLSIPQRIVGPFDITIEPILAESKRNSFFELGYQYRIQRFDFPVRRSFDKQIALGEHTKSSSSSSNAQGFNLAFGLNENWKIYSGLSYSSLNIIQESSLVFKYDKSREHINDRGEVINDLSYRTSSPYGETRADMTIFIPFDLRDEDYLEFRFIDKYRINIHQIPFGIEYNFGHTKVNWLLRGGVQWNILAIKDYSISSSILFRDRPLNLERDAVLSKSLTNNNFISGHVGVGLNCQILGNWYTHVTAAYNHSFINNKGTNDFGSNTSGTYLEVGFNYRF